MSEQKDEIARFHALEQEGLHRAEDRDSKSKDDDGWFGKVQNAINEEMRPYYRKMGENDWEHFATQLANASYYGNKDATSCKYSQEKKVDCPTSSNTYDYLADTDNQYAILSNRPPPITKRCTHLVAAKTAHEYKLNHALNDVTACLHRSIEHYEEMARAWHKEGKCMWRE